MRTDRGFVLPTTLLVMTLLTIMLTAAFTMVSAEYRTTDNSLGRTRAHALAQAGMQSYSAMNRALSGTYDSVRVTLTGGYADVVARRLRDSTASDLQLWLIRSTGVSSDPTQPGQVTGRRSTVQIANYNPAGLPRHAAYVAVSGAYIKGFYGPSHPAPIRGEDNAACSPYDPTYGLVTRTGGYTTDQGDAPIGPVNPTLANSAAVLAWLRINWTSLLAGNFTPDVTLPGGTPTWSNEVVMVTGNYTLDASGANPKSGILVVTGNLTISGAVQYEGIILVGGYLTGSGSYTVRGMVVTGLNIALGQTVPRDTIDRQAPTLHYWSCEVKAAEQTMSGLQMIRNAWTDTWTTY